MRVRFLGAAGTVTGSKHLIEAGGTRILLDCGLFQGFKQLRQLNWRRLPVDPSSIDAVVLSHAHIDHSGYLPVLVKNGFRGPVHGTEGTAALCRILLPDAGHIEEEWAERANRRGYTRHEPAKPLFTEDDAWRAVKHLRPAEMGSTLEIGSLRITFLPAGHILGASLVRVEHEGRSLLFTGDLGRPDEPIMLEPAQVASADWLITEATYGDRLHGESDPEAELEAIIHRTLERGGKVICPAFAVGRTQRLLYHLWKLREEGRIPPVPVWLNSPLASQATEIFRTLTGAHRLSAEVTDAICALPRIASTMEESIRLNHLDAPAIIIAGSGMATGGRVVHHIQHYGPDPRNTLLFTGFQAAGTRGAALCKGVDRLKMFGMYVDIRAEVCNVSGFSAHADQAELLGWMRGFDAPPRRTFVVHGEPGPADTLRHTIEEQLGWKVDVPLQGDEVELD